MDSKKNAYHVGDVARSLGISPRTVRYYEEMGLLHPSRSDGGFRIYTSHDLDLLKFIVRFRDLGISIEEIRALISGDPGHAARIRRAELKNTLTQRRSEFEDKIAGLKKAVEQIDRVLDQINRCEKCSTETEREICRECLSAQPEEVSPLLESLIDEG